MPRDGFFLVRRVIGHKFRLWRDQRFLELLNSNRGTRKRTWRWLLSASNSVTLLLP